MMDAMSAMDVVEVEPELTREADHARLIVDLYHKFLHRNPDPKGFAHYLERMQNGLRPSDITEIFRTAPEARNVAAEKPARSGQFAWKAEDRPIHVTDRFWISEIELTNRCPFSCVMCPRTDHMTRAQGVMEFSLFKKIIDELVSLNPHDIRMNEPMWLHHFGESLVHPEFGKLIRYAQSCGIKARLSVNPLMLSESIAEELLDAEPAYLVFALDGHDDESFAKIRGVSNAYEKSKRNLIRFLNKKVAAGKKIHATLSVIDFPLNNMTAAENRQTWERHWKSVPGIDQFLWKPFVTWNGSMPEITALGRASPEAEAMQAHLKHFKVTCDWPWKRMIVTWNGNVVACCYDFDAKYVIGNANTQSLDDIWNGAPMQNLRREFVSGRVTNPLCASCKYLRASQITVY